MDDYNVGGASNRCHESTSQHTWNFNSSSYPGSSLPWVCSTIGLDYNGPLTGGTNIYGSGCGGSTNFYSFCHAPVFYTYYAWIGQQDNGSSHTLDGWAQTDRTCGSFAREASNSDKAAASGTVSQLRQSFAVYGANTRPAQVPAAVSGLLAAGAKSTGTSYDTSDAREVGPVDAPETVFLVPASDRVCQVLLQADQSTLASSCNASDPVATLGAPSITQSAGGFVTWGVLPDGAGNVQIVSGDDVRDVATSNNGYAVTTTTFPDEIRWTDAERNVHTVAAASLGLSL